ncbi:MAG: hypothetical protein HYW51_00825 [Candidatus Doudnabacteria bacterium]|nr:hypothetical protein [Candidatus Doudnabacteria bacterium]
MFDTLYAVIRKVNIFGQTCYHISSQWFKPQLPNPEMSAVFEVLDAEEYERVRLALVALSLKRIQRNIPYQTQRQRFAARCAPQNHTGQPAIVLNFEKRC